MNHKIFICENSLDGIFTGVYDAWAAAREIGHSHCKIETKTPCYENGTMKELRGGVREDSRNYELFSEYIMVEPDEEKTKKVTKAVKEKLGHLVYQELCKAIAAEAPDLLYGGKEKDFDKGDAIYRTIVTGFAMEHGDEVMKNLANPYVARVFELTRRIGREYLHWIEFLRFHELKNGVLFSRIAPENNLLEMIAPHFADRLPLENFMIYDERRGLFVIHRAGDPKNPIPVENSWAIVQGEKPDEEAITDYSDREEYYQELFTSFCHAIAIEPRINWKLQRQMLPLKFRKYMVEFEQFDEQKSL